MNVRLLTLLTALICAALILASGAGLFFLLRGPPDAPQRAEVFIGPSRLVFAPGYARLPSARRGGRFERLDLAASFPKFAPAGEVTEASPSLDLAERGARTVFLTLTQADNTVDPAERPVKLYARFLEKEEWSHPGGLVMRRFSPGSPFDNEDLYIAPPEGRLFSARCMRPAVSPDGLPDTCIHEFRVNGLNAQLRFAPALLADWESLSEGARRLVEGMAR